MAWKCPDGHDVADDSFNFCTVCGKAKPDPARDVTILQGQVATLQGEVNGLKERLDGLREEVAGIVNTELLKFREELSSEAQVVEIEPQDLTANQARRGTPLPMRRPAPAPQAREESSQENLLARLWNMKLW